MSAYALAECSDVDGLNSVKLYYRKKTVGGSYGGYTELTNGQHNVLGGFAGDTSYVVELSALDTAGNRSAVEIDVPTAAAAFHLREGGRGAAFGKYAERDNLLECDWDAQFNGDVAVAGELTVGGMRVQQIQSGTTTVSAPPGDTEFSVTFPDEFKNVPVVIAQAVTTRPDILKAASYTTTKTGFIGHIYNASAGSTYSVNVRWIAVD